MPSSLSALKEKFIQLELDIAHSQIKHQDLDDIIQNLRHQLSNLEHRVKTLTQYDSQIESGKKHRQETRLWEIGEKLSNEEELMRVEAAKQQAILALKRDYRIQPDEIPDAWKKINQQLTTLNQIRNGLPNVNKMRQQQQAIGQIYRDERQGDSPAPVPGGSQPTESANRDKKQEKDLSLADRMVITKAESKLQQLCGEQKKSRLERGRRNEREMGE